jgi:uncharacterized protein
MDRMSWLLMALDAAEDRGLDPAQLQKVLFLLAQEVPAVLGVPNFYQFVPYNYGPFSKLVYVDAEMLAQAGLVNMLRAPGSSYPIYQITPAGAIRARVDAREADPRAFQYLTALVNWAKGLTFSQLVTSIYKKYPAFRVNSVFQD